MFVYVIRHGQSETNVSHVWTGWRDVMLTDKGIQDAHKAGEYLNNVSFDKVFSSDLTRAYRTAQIALPNYEIEQSKELREINVGTLSGQPHECLTKEERACASLVGYAQYEGESKEDMNERIRTFMKKMELLDYGFNLYKVDLIRSKEDRVGTISLEKSSKDEIAVYPKSDITMQIIT